MIHFFLRGLALFAVTAVWVVWPLAGQAQVEAGIERITDFAVRVQVNQDGTIRVTETIDYFFPEQRHGIYRDIPTHYQGDDGTQWEIPLQVLSVASPTGAPAQYKLIQQSAGIRLKIGDPDRTMQGLQQYVIVYEATGALRYFEDHDELYWNVTGTEWAVPIEHSRAVVQLPDGIAVSATRCYTGEQGGREQDCERSHTGRQAEFSATGFLTVVVAWPPDLVAELLPKRFNPWLAAVWGLLPSLAAFFFMHRHWKRHGRDAPVSPTELVQYDPPANMPPAELGTLLDGTAHTVDVVACIIDLAVRGYLKIRETKTKGNLFYATDHELQLLKPDYRQDGQLKAYEVKVLGTLFSTGDRILLSQIKDDYVFFAALPDIKRQVGSQLVHDGHYAKEPMAVRHRYLVIVFVALGVALFGGGMAIAAGAAFVIGSAAGGMAVAVGCLVAVVIIGVYGWHMPKLTPKGAQATHHARGFKQYVGQAEKYRIQWQEQENIFEKFLPYAMVFGVARKWGEAFADIDMDRPSWYEGTAFRSGAFNAAAFTGSFDALSRAVKAAVSAKPSSSSSGSGFSGGGFSGGGGGGGGGGSW